jgi:hypothetical protein
MKAWPTRSRQQRQHKPLHPLLTLILPSNAVGPDDGSDDHWGISRALP